MMLWRRDVQEAKRASTYSHHCFLIEHVQKQAANEVATRLQSNFILGSAMPVQVTKTEPFGRQKGYRSALDRISKIWKIYIARIERRN